jgi:S1-C subfamily serine protease
MITSGNVSSLTGFGKNFSNFSHTAPSQPGNSGGPIINQYGSVVGVLVAGINEEFIKEVSGTLPQNINFGIKNTVLKSLLNDNNTKFSSRESFFSKSQKNIAELSKKSAVLIKCYGYPENT